MTNNLSSSVSATVPIHASSPLPTACTITIDAALADALYVDHVYEHDEWQNMLQVGAGGACRAQTACRQPLYCFNIIAMYHICDDYAIVRLQLLNCG